jgi:hypothetical protein
MVIIDHILQEEKVMKDFSKTVMDSDHIRPDSGFAAGGDLCDQKLALLVTDLENWQYEPQGKVASISG